MTHKVKNRIKQIVRTPMFKQRIVQDKTKYTRNTKHKNKKGYISKLINSFFI